LLWEVWRHFGLQFLTFYMGLDSLPICKQKWVWSFFALQIPKCGTTSIQKACGQRNLVEKHRSIIENKYQNHPLYRGVFDVRHCTPEHLISIFGRQVFDFFSFCCVRNPAERILSSFSFGKAKELWKVYNGLSSNTTLSEYISWLHKNRHRKDILILLPQVTWADNRIFPVEILRFENLQEDWRDMLKKHQINGLPDSLPHENKSQHKDWREEISGENLKMLLDFTAEDRILYPELYD